MIRRTFLKLLASLAVAPFVPKLAKLNTPVNSTTWSGTKLFADSIKVDSIDGNTVHYTINWTSFEVHDGRIISMKAIGPSQLIT